jgi:putative transposase
MPHHVTQRGNRRQQTFFCEDDYAAYLALMRQCCGRFGVSVWAYCLMPNHVHLIVVPAGEEGLRRAIGEAHRRYTERVNRREGWTGHLWQGRFASFVMDEPYLLAAARYVEINPFRARLVDRPEAWPWSSAAVHTAGRADALAQSDWLRDRTAGWVCSWREFLMGQEQADIGLELRRHENTGRPLGDKTFVRKLEDCLARPLLPAKRGPKPKTSNKK